MTGFKLSTMLAVATLTVTIAAFLGLAVWDGVVEWSSTPVGWAPNTGAALAATPHDNAPDEATALIPSPSISALRPAA